ncbi:hypothetical protein BU17DRAFT_84313 [Hysterangium stoloniferum]|nr:hypothetical protein BU17DRAFT_84313 [Hysterangium stoloniferum]
MASKDISPQSYARTLIPAMRKRKPAVTYQSPGSGVVDMSLLVRNTALEFEVASAAAVASRSALALVPVSTPTPSHASSLKVPSDANAPQPLSQKVETKSIHLFSRPMSIPRPPRPLYHPLSRPILPRSPVKSIASNTSTNSQSATLSTEPGRRSSSRTRRPALKVRDTESVVGSAKVVPDKPSSIKRKRGGVAAKRKRTTAQQEADGDSAYPAAKRLRKPKERVEVDADGDTMHPSTNDGSPTTGYSTRAKRPRNVTHGRAESATSDGTGSVTRTTPINGPIEEFWVPTKTA